MAATITEISIRGYKSIERLDRFPLGPLNVLVGANGAGKSNFFGVIRLLRALSDRALQPAVLTAGGVDVLLHFGPTVTSEIRLEIALGDYGYRVVLTPTAHDQAIIADEAVTCVSDATEPDVAIPRWRGTESGLDIELRDGAIHRSWTASAMRRLDDVRSTLTTYQFDDTSPSAAVRRRGAINDDERLRPNASNLAAYLHRLAHSNPGSLSQVRDVVRLAVPFFDDFKLRPIATNPDQIWLEWTQVGTDYPFRQSQLSDGTLRFICLATALLQPDPPAVMMFDEPELGLHPYALTLLAALFRQAAAGPTQVIVSTQSATLLNEFDAEDVIVVERQGGASTFRRLDPAALTEWLAEYSVGELWQKNVFGGQPTAEAVGGPS